MPPLLRSLICLRPPKGPTLALKDKETWIGRGTFELSARAQSFCSRRQACLKQTDTAVQLECHGLNPIYFVACHSVNFQGKIDTPLSSLYLLRKGEIVDLTDGDQFFLAPKECLLTVGIRDTKSGQNGTAVQFTQEAGSLSIHDEKLWANQILSPKATQKEKASEVCLDEQRRLLQTGDSARPWSIADSVPLTDRCLSGRISNLDTTELKFTCNVAEGHKCKVESETVAPILSQLQVIHSSNCSIGQVDLLKDLASADRALVEVRNNVRGSIVEINPIKTTKGFFVPDRPSLACSPTSAPEVLGSAESSGKVGSYLDFSSQGIPGAGSSKEGLGCGRISDTSACIISESFEPYNNDTCLNSLGPSKGDHNIPDDSDGLEHVMSHNVTVSKFSAQFPDSNKIRKDKPSEMIYSVEPEHIPPQSWQPCCLNSSPNVFSALPISLGCFTGSISNLDTRELKCLTSSVGHKSKVVGDTIAPPLSELDVFQIDHCSVAQVETSQALESGHQYLVGIFNGERGSIVEIDTSRTTEGFCVPDSPYLACSPTFAPEVMESAESSGKAGGYLGFTSKAAVQADNSKEGVECGPSSEPSICVRSEGFEPYDKKGVQVDHNLPEYCDEPKQVSTKHVCMSRSHAQFLDPRNKAGEIKPSEIIDSLGPEHILPQSWQPCHSSSSPNISNALPIACMGSEVEVAALCGKSVTLEIPEKIEGILVASSSAVVTSSEKKGCLGALSGGSPMIVEENDLPDGRRVFPQQADMAHKGQGKPNFFQKGPVQGMETVIATVSGYDDLSRGRLISLINMTGAAYTGSLTKCNTHVVCWKFKGPKYEMAKKLGKTIINHRWFEDCLKAGKRLSEGLYKSSGELEEPFCWEDTSVLSRCKTGNMCGKSCRSLFKEENSQGQLGPPIDACELPVPPSCRENVGELSGQTALPFRSKSGVLDKGKRHSVVDLTSPVNKLHACSLDTVTCDTQSMCPRRSNARKGDNKVVIPSLSCHAQEQESDDFWNEVIRTVGIDEQLVVHSSQVVTETDLSAVMRSEHKTRGTRQADSPIGGLFSREPAIKFESEVTDQSRDQSETGAHPSDDVRSGGFSEVVHSHFSGREQSGNVPEDDQILLRKRKHMSACFSGESSGKHRKLVRKSEQLRLSNRLRISGGCGVSIVGGITVRGQPTSLIPGAQLRASTMDKKRECQQSSGMLNTVIELACTPEETVDASASSDITCVICHSDAKLTTEGLLTCGHTFCYPCIQRWADEAKSKAPTCPLCKVPFDFITFREMGKTEVDGCCTQVVEEKIVEVVKHTGQEIRRPNLPSLRTENLCIACGSRDTQELLLICTNCNERACHTFCLDPPRPPGSSWFCSRCSHAQSRIQVREAYGRLFQGSSPQAAHRQAEMVDMGMTYWGPPSGRIGGLFGGQSSRTPPRRGRQHSLYNYLVRNNM